MKWNYRIMRHKSPDGDYYGIHEVYYDGDKLSWTEKPEVVAESVEGLKTSLEWMMLSLAKPVLDYEPSREEKIAEDLPSNNSGVDNG